MMILRIRGVPVELFLALKQRAERNHRSLNREVIACLEGVVQAPTLDVERWLANVERLHGEAKLPEISPARLPRLKNRGHTGF